MGLNFPKYPGDVSDGDEHSHSPNKTKDSLLATKRGTDSTRRLETDDNRNLYVNVAAPNPLPITGSVDLDKAFNATTVPITVTGVSIVIVAANAARKKLLVQTNDPVLIRLDGVVSLGTYSVEMPKKSLYEIENYCGSVTAIKLSAGSTSVLVTEVF